MTTYRFRIENDHDFSPADSVAWVDPSTSPAEQEEARQAESEYVRQFETGHYAALGLILERRADPCPTCGRGGGWEVVDSLWGISVDVDEEWRTGGAFPNDGEPVSPEYATAWTTYLGEVAREMLAEHSQTV